MDDPIKNMAMVLLAILIVIFLTNWRISILEDEFNQYTWEHRSTTVESVE